MYTSVGNKLFVLFKSDFFIAHQGFFARFNASADSGKRITFTFTGFIFVLLKDDEIVLENV